jgi:hypothetical protein
VTGSGVAIIFLVFGVGALLAVSIPGLCMGLLIGAFVKHRNYSFIACFLVSVVAALISCWWLTRQPNGFVDSITAFVILGAWLTMTSLGAWLGRKTAAASPRHVDN